MRLTSRLLFRRQGWLLAGITLLCVMFILLPSLPGVQFAPPPALRFPLIVIGMLFLPGYLLDELLRVSGPRLNLTSPPLWFALSCSVLAPAGWLVLGLHTSLRPFGLVAGGLIVVLCLTVLVVRGSLRGGEWEFGRRDLWLWLLAIALFLIILALIIFWAPPGTLDYWIYRAYLREYVDSPAINLWDPFLGAGAPVTPRLRYETWLALEAFMGLATGLDPAFALPEALDPLCAVLALLATYALARELLGTARRALAATSLQMMAYLYSPLIMQPGHYVLIRTSEDKSVAFFILFPLAAALIMRAVTRRDRAAWWGIVLVAVGLVAVHGMSYVLLMLLCGLFFITLVLFRMPRDQQCRLLGITLSILPLCIFVVMTVINVTASGPTPGGVGWNEFMAARLAAERIIYLGNTSLFIANPELVFFPVSIAGLLATPLLLLRRRRNVAAALLFGTEVGPLFLLFIPGVPNLIGRFLDFKVIYRMHWVSFPALTVAFVLASHWHTIGNIAQKIWARYRGLFRPARHLLAAVAVILALGLGTSLILSPLTYRGSEMTFPDQALRAVLEATAPAVRQMGSPLVLAYTAETFHIPAVWGLARTLITRGELLGTQEHLPPERQQEALDRAALVASLPTARADDAHFVDQLQKLGVDLIVLSHQETPAISASLDRFPLSYLKVFQTAEHTIYLVNLSAPTALAVLGEAQLALAQGNRSEACAQFERAYTLSPTSPLAQAGTGLCADLAGETERARQAYQSALVQLGDGSWQPDWPPALASWLTWHPQLADELVRTIRTETLEFVQQRLYHLGHISDRASGAESIWIGGWPLAAEVQSIGALAPFDVNIQGSEAPVRAIAESAGIPNVVVAIMAETPAGLKLVKSQKLDPTASNWMEMVLPPDASGRLWLGALSGEPAQTALEGKVTWSLWVPDNPDLERPRFSPDEETLRLANWLAGERDQLLGTSTDVRVTTSAARIMLGKAEKAEKEERTSLSSKNLLSNPTFDDEIKVGWRTLSASANVRVERERLEGPDVGWAARIQSDGQGYQGGLCQVVQVQPGQRYIYAFRAYADLAPGSKVSLAYWDYQRLGFFSSSTGAMLKETATSWMPFWQLLTVPAGVHSISICPALLTGPATVRIDQVWLLPLEALR